ncbi:unnamed protein product [Ectocarpus sp. CCAP 1310/34]|nr:unnamed protein product [Ectocarpus sp. CCAP 1310/34]
MGNATSSVAEIKKKGDEYNKAVRRERALSGMPGLAQQMSSKRFKKDDPNTEQWKIFNDLDVQDDKLMLDLAVFLNRLVSRFPDRGDGLMKEDAQLPTLDESVPIDGAAMSGQTDNTETYFMATNTDGDDTGVTLDSIHMEDAARPVPSLLRIGSVSVSLGEGTEENLMDYSLSKAPPTMATVEEVMQLFESGGQLSTKTVRKILRDAYKHLKGLGNINKVPLNSTEESVTVVGDIHGQLADLVCLMNHNGLPSETNKYIFNGDFVDRGFQGVEVLVLLFLLMTVFPNSVFLNRGNHEDFGLCCVYGFQKECLDKYNDVVFSMFCEMFRHLPVCSVIHDKVLVIHGGLFHREGVTLADIEQVERLDYVVPARSEEDRQDDSNLSEAERRQKDLRTIMHCALWSDPDLSPSLPNPQPNPRGAGVLFGPDSTKSFLDENGLDMVVRSHECVEEGFDLPFEDEMEGCCATIFSASNYGGSMNQGATMRFSLNETDDSFAAGGMRATSPEVHYTVFEYQLTAADKDHGHLLKANQSGLSSLVLRKKRALTAAFTQVDKQGDGFVTKDKWCQVMSNVTGLQISWKAILNIIVDEEDREGDKINWRAFMSKFHVKLSARASKGVGKNVAMFDAMYADREKLEAIFRFFDTDGNGSISREEFHRGCELLNQQAGEGEYLENIDVILGVMDMDNNDSIDINEFFEVFRLVDAADGTVDGKYGSS